MGQPRRWGRSRHADLDGRGRGADPVQALAKVGPDGVAGKGPTGPVQIGRFPSNLGSRRLVAATAIDMLSRRRRPDDRAALLANCVEADREGSTWWRGAAAIGPRRARRVFIHSGERDGSGRPAAPASRAGTGTRRPEMVGFAQRGTSASAAAGVPWQAVRAWPVHADPGYRFAGG